MHNLPADDIKTKIHTIRGQQVMLDEDLAGLYDVEVRQLNQAVKRNSMRFPSRYVFRFSKAEYAELKSQTVISSWGAKRKMPYAFTEEGVAMLSAVLKSATAIHVSIQIMKAFVAMRRFLSQNAEVFSRLDKVERKQLEHDQQFERVFQAIEDHQITPNKGIFFDPCASDTHNAYIFVDIHV